MRLKVSSPPAAACNVVVQSLADLQAAINRYLADHNTDPKPFIWTADPDTIIAAASRGCQTFDSIH
jgi:hypothetical protein